MNRGQLLTHARRRLTEQDVASSFWSDLDLNDYLDRAHEQFVSEAELNQCESTTPSNLTFNGLYANPVDTLRVLRVFYEGRATPLEESSLQKLDAWHSGWRASTSESGSTPSLWAPFGQQFFLVPKPAETGKVITLWCVQAPPPFVDDASVPLVPSSYHETIAIGAAIRCLESDRTNPDNKTAIDNLKGWWAMGLSLAKSQKDRRAPQQQVKDIRDYYSSEWRP